MSKVYVRRYTDNGTPLAKPPITVTVGMQRSVEIPFPSEGYLTRLTVKQTDGTSVGFDIELLDSMVPYPPGETVVGAAAADDVELYRIIPQQNVSAGNTLELINNEHGYPFHNTDGTYTANQRKIYMLIVPDGAVDDTTYEVSFTAHTDVG